MSINVQTIINARYPEDVFGDDPRETYRKLAQRYHPDNKRTGDEETFKLLNTLYQRANEALKAGYYGKRQATANPILITTRRHAYTVDRLVYSGNIAAIYAATYPDDDETQGAFLKVVRQPSNGSAIAHEAQVLKSMLKTKPEMFDILSPYLPRYIEAFGYRHGNKTRQAIAFGHDRQYPVVTLKTVQQVYPNGVHPKDSAWMMRRLLMVLGLTHAMGWTHTQVNSHHVIIQPEQHGLVLLDWTKAVAQEHWAKETPGQDIVDGIRCLVEITAMSQAPTRYRRFINGCQRYPHRLPDALTLKDEYDELIVDLWGPRKFRPFAMPVQTR